MIETNSPERWSGRAGTRKPSDEVFRFAGIDAVGRFSMDTERFHLTLEAGSLVVRARCASSASFRKSLAAWIGGDPGGWPAFTQTRRLQSMVAARL